MAIAATPDYLGKDFSTASPGLRFGMYLQIWSSSFAKEKETVEPLKRAGRLNDHDKAVMAALFARQQAGFNAMVAGTDALQLDAVSTAPFTTGLGNEHPTENGFAFLNPYGLPYLPGSGVKGVLRQAARELASPEWGEAHGWDERAITALFGLESKDGDHNHQRGALSFWDVMPQIKGDSLQVEIMTPHQGHYYQGKQSPHDSGQPIPIHFLTVPPGSGFTFYVQCNLALLQQTAPELATNETWKVLLGNAFAHAFNWCGFGAKTAVGYGAMAEDPKARQQRQEMQAKAQALAEEQAKAERLATLSPEDRAWEQAQPILDGFSNALAQAKAAGDFHPSGTFSPARLEFIKTVLTWTEIRSRLAAAELLESSATKEWGRPNKKERWKELQDAIATLREPG